MDTKNSPLSLLNDPTQLKTDALFAGQWVKGAARFDADDPATGGKLAWKSAVAIGLAAGVFQMTINMRPAPRVEAERARNLLPIAQSG